MARYFSRPKAIQPRARDDDIWDPLLPSLTVDDHVAVDTGLIDHRGDPILRAPNEIGFGREVW